MTATFAVAFDVPIALPTAADTEALGERLAVGLGAGDLVVLAGPLGAGKTVLVRGLARGLGVTGPVTSPTFVIAREHRPSAPGGVPLVHVDAYRLGGAAELDDLDLDTDLADAVVAVEWGEGVAERLAGRHLLVRLDRRPDDVRTAVVTLHRADDRAADDRAADDRAADDRAADDRAADDRAADDRAADDRAGEDAERGGEAARR